MTPDPSANNAMASVRAVMIVVFATELELRILIFPSQMLTLTPNDRRQGPGPSENLVCDYRRSVEASRRATHAS